MNINENRRESTVDDNDKESTKIECRRKQMKSLRKLDVDENQRKIYENRKSAKIGAKSTNIKCQRKHMKSTKIERQRKQRKISENRMSTKIYEKSTRIKRRRKSRKNQRK